MAIGAICVISYCVQEQFIMAVFPAVALLASIGIAARVSLLRSKIMKGEMGEMKRGVQMEEAVEARVNVELQDGNKFRVVEEVGKARSNVKVAVGVGEGDGKPRPSFNSQGTGIMGAPEKVVREFV